MPKGSFYGCFDQPASMCNARMKQGLQQLTTVSVLSKEEQTLLAPQYTYLTLAILVVPSTDVYS